MRNRADPVLDRRPDLRQPHDQGHAAGAAIDSEDTLNFSVFGGVRPQIETMLLARYGGLREDDERQGVVPDGADDGRVTERRAAIAPSQRGSPERIVQARWGWPGLGAAPRGNPVPYRHP
jgi:hypothetical protein